MKFSTAALVLVVTAGLAATSVTARNNRTALAAAPTAVAVVDMQAAINKSAEIKVKNEALKTRADARMAELDKAKKELENLVESSKVLGMIPGIGVQNYF